MEWVEAKPSNREISYTKRMKTSARRRFCLWWNRNGLSTHCWTNDQTLRANDSHTAQHTRLHECYNGIGFCCLHLIVREVNGNSSIQWDEEQPHTDAAIGISCADSMIYTLYAMQCCAVVDCCHTLNRIHSTSTTISSTYNSVQFIVAIKQQISSVQYASVCYLSP